MNSSQNGTSSAHLGYDCKALRLINHNKAVETELKQLALEVVEIRHASGLSQETLASLAGISRRPIYLLESGKGAVRLDNFLKIVAALGLEMRLVPRSPRDDD